MHHLPSLAEVDPLAPDDEASWSRAILPLLEGARVRLLLSGTLERADGRAILWLPYRRGKAAKTREVALEAPGWAVVGYSRAQALAEKAVLPVDFGALDGEARVAGRGAPPARAAPHLRQPRDRPSRPCSPRCVPVLPATCCGGRSTRPATCAPPGAERLGIPPGEAAMGLGKLLVVAPDQENARQYLGWLRGWVPRGPGRACGAHRHLGRAGRACDAGGLPPAAGALDPGHLCDGL